MNDKYSTTEDKTSEKLSDEAMLSAQWKNIDWHKAEREVNRLQTVSYTHLTLPTKLEV